MRSYLSSALLLTLVSNIYGLDLAPRELEMPKDGPTSKRYFFPDGSKQVSFRMDDRMSVGGSGGGAAFRFNDIPSASMTLSKSSLKPEMTFEAQGLEAYRTAAQNFVPPNSAEIQLEAETADAIALNGWSSHQFVFVYKLFGFQYRRSVTFINYNEKEQLVLDIAAPIADYENIYSRSYRVLNSLTDRPVAAMGPT